MDQQVTIPLKELEALEGLTRKNHELRAEVERLKVLIVGLLHADEDAFEQARKLGPSGEWQQGINKWRG